MYFFIHGGRGLPKNYSDEGGGGHAKKIGNWGGGVIQFSNYTPPNPTTAPYPIKNKRSLITRVYICTHFHIKRKRHRHFLGFPFAAKLDFSKIVATGRSQVKLSSSETIRIHYCRLLLQNSSRLSSHGRKCCDISLDV